MARDRFANFEGRPLGETNAQPTSDGIESDSIASSSGGGVSLFSAQGPDGSLSWPAPVLIEVSSTEGCAAQVCKSHRA
jgi:hypothetical protein